MATAPLPALAVRQLCKSFPSEEGSQQVLFDIDLSLAGGQMVFVVGPSGCGKTTLISIIAGILSADSGEVTLFDTSILRLSKQQQALFRQANIGFIFQQFNLVPTITLEENVAIPLLIAGKPTAEALSEAKRWLVEVGLGDHLGKLPKQLSGGQQQRVAIARALISQPKLIICDEPTSSLDGKTGHHIMELLQSVAVQPGRLVIIVTHDPRIYEFANTLIHMEDGRIVSVEASI